MVGIRVIDGLIRVIDGWSESSDHTWEYNLRYLIIGN